MSASCLSSDLHHVEEIFRDVKSRVLISEKYSVPNVVSCFSTLVNSSFKCLIALVSPVSILSLVLANAMLREILTF